MTVHRASLPFACASPALGAVAMCPLSPSLPSSFPEVSEGLLGGALSVLNTTNTRAVRCVTCSVLRVRKGTLGGVACAGDAGLEEVEGNGPGQGLARMGPPRVTSRLVWGTAAPLYGPRGAKLGCELVAGHLGRT